MAYDISVFLPSIRVHLLNEWYKTLVSSCNKLSLEVIVVGPFDIPNELKLPNIQYIKDYGSPTRCAQIAAINCSSDIIYHTTDDVYFYPEAMFEAYKQLKSLDNSNDYISMRYIEGSNHNNNISYPLDYWSAGNDINYRDKYGIDKQWIINCHFLMYKELFFECGGFDCSFDYLTFACSDMHFRLQKNGSTIHHSRFDICNADWYDTITGDHAPIHYTQILHDTPLFHNLWSNNRQFKIDIDNWKSSSDIWTKRFHSKQIKNYNELYPNIV